MNRLHLQLALDITDLSKVRQMAKVAAPIVDTLEIGTPLLISAGTAVLKEVKGACGDNPCVLFADTKISDEGASIARTCYRAGADIVSVVDGASTATLRAVRAVADEFGKDVWVDLLSHANPMIRARALAPFANGFILHRPHSGLPPLLVEGLLSLDRPIRVAGGVDTGLAREIATMEWRDVGERSTPFEGIIVGRAITEAEAFEEALQAFAAICHP